MSIINFAFILDYATVFCSQYKQYNKDKIVVSSIKLSIINLLLPAFVL